MSEVEERYKPGPGFELDTREPLLDLSPNASTELWLIQWPASEELPGIHMKEISLSLDKNGCLGSFEDASGKVYEVVDSCAGDPNAAVFVSSESETRIVGKISRRVSLVHYSEPKELERQEAAKKLRRQNQSSHGSSLMKSSVHSGSRMGGSKLRDSPSRTTTHSKHRPTQTVHNLGEGPSSKKAKRSSHHTMGSTDRSTLDSGGRSSLTNSGTSKK